MELTKTLLKNAIYAPDMVFMLILVSHLDDANCSATFHRGIYTIKNTTGCTIATIPYADSLYHIIAASESLGIDYANVTSINMTISEVHQKLGHIVHATIKHTILQGLITSIELNLDSSPEFCEACAKAKSTW